MKTIIKFAYAIAMVIAFISCNKEPVQNGPVEYVYAKLNFSGDVTIQPLDTKASESVETFESGDLLVLGIYNYKNDSYSWTQALNSSQGGAFTDASNIVIPLLKGGIYQIIAVVIKDVASSAKWAEFSTFNKLIDRVPPLFSMMIDGKYINHYKSYRGGQRFIANSDLELNLNMVKNYFGVTLNYSDVKGQVMVCGCSPGGTPPINSYADVTSGETTLMKFSENSNTGTGDKGRCETYEEQCITTGDNPLYDPDYLRGFDIWIARSLDGEISYLNVINVEIKAGDNVIVNIEEADFTGYSGELSLDFSDDDEMTDVYYN